MAENGYQMPDLQLRMSKKIAQLTNVIHHLHTKTEDHEIDLQEMAAAYESEIESMLKDAATRINSFKNQLEAARDDSRFQEAVQKVKAEHEQLRQASISELEAFKQKMSDREVAVQNAARKQLADTNSQVQELVKRLDAAAADLDAVKRMAHEETSQLNMQLAKAKEETEEAIKEGNHRYNSMLNDRMNKADQLMRSLESLKLEIASKEASIKSLQDDVSKREAEAAAAHARQQKAWDEERRASAAQQAKAETKWQERLQAAMCGTEEQRQLTLAANRKIGALDGALAEAKDKHAAELSKGCRLERQIAELRSDLRQAESKKEAFEGTAAEGQERVRTLQDQVAALKADHTRALAGAEDQHARLQAEVGKLSAQLHASQKEVKDLTESHKKAIQEHGKAHSAAQSAESELHDLRLAFADLKDLRDSEKAKHGAAMEAEQVAHAALLRSKEKELAAAHEQLHQERVERENAMQEGQKSAADVRAQLAAEMKRKLEDSAQAHVAEMRRLQAERDAEIAAASARHQAQIGKLQMQQEEHLLKATQQHEAEVEACTSNLKNAAAADLAQCQEMWTVKEKALECEAKKLREQLEQLQTSQDQLKQQQLQQTKMSDAEQRQLKEQIFSLKQQLQMTEHKLAEVLRNLEHTQEESSQYQAQANKESASIAAKLQASKQTIQDLQARNECNRREAEQLLEQKLEQLRADLTAQWQQKMEGSVADSLSSATRYHNDQLEFQKQKLADSLEKTHTRDVQDLKNRHTEELASLQRSLGTQHEEQLAAQRRDWQIKLDTASSSASLNIESLKSAAADEVARAKQAHASDVERRDAHHKQEVQDILQQHTQSMDSAKASHEAALKELRGDLDRTVWQKDKELAALKDRTSKDLKSAKEASEKTASEAHILQARLEGQIKQLREKVTAAETQIKQLTAKAAELQQALVQKATSMSDALRQMGEEHADAMAAAEQSFADEISAKDEAHSRSVAALQATLEDVRAEAEEKYDSLAQAYGELRGQWETRGPREEDVERIRGLMSTLEDRDAKIAAFEQRYNELHNEMLLREDNYNNRFANGGAGRHKLAVDKAMSSTQDVSEWMLKRPSRAGAVARSNSVGPRSSFKTSSARSSIRKSELDR